MARASHARISAAVLAVLLQGCAPTQPSESAQTGEPARFTYVHGSTQEVCQLTGATNQVNAERFGLIAADRGYSFLHEGKLWFLFGDSQPTPFFPRNGPHDPNTNNTHNRWGPGSGTANLNNDSIAFAATTAPGVCPSLQFIPQRTPAVGAYTSPSLSYDGTAVPLRTNEGPFAGVDVNGNAYVIFGTNNPNDTNTPETCRDEKTQFCLGSPFTTVLARLDDRDALQFTGLYTFSGPPPGQTPTTAGRFIQVAIAPGPDGYLYFFGTTGGGQRPGARPCGTADECYRHSYVRLARMLPQEIEHATNGRAAKLEFWAQSAGATGDWVDGDESAATPLFRDDPPCMGEAGVEYNQGLRQWVMLYNCVTASPSGIQMRTAPSPQGPWTTPQVIFNPERDRGLCYFIHSQDGRNCPPGAPNPPQGKPHAQNGGNYGPYFIAGWTTSSTAADGGATSTFYYTIDTFVPYGVVIEKSTIHANP